MKTASITGGRLNTGAVVGIELTTYGLQDLATEILPFYINTL
jgi:hypothetical protein